MFSFLKSHAGRAVCGLAVMVGMVVIPDLLNWVAATLALAWSVHHLREAFRIADSEAEHDDDDDAAGRLAA